MKGKMGPLMKKHMNKGKGHGAAHKAAMKELAAGWKRAKGKSSNGTKRRASTKRKGRTMLRKAHGR